MSHPVQLSASEQYIADMLLQNLQQQQEILTILKSNEKPDDKLDLVSLEISMGVSSRALAERARLRGIRLVKSDRDSRAWAIYRKDLPELQKKFPRAKRKYN
jgi:hypothetical protein